MYMASLRQSVHGRATIAATGFAFAAVSLAGCSLLMTPLPTVDVAVQRDGGALVVANCDRPVAGEFRVRISETVDNQWATFFIAEAEAGWAYAEAIRPDSDVWVNVEQSDAASLTPGSSIEVGLTADELAGGASFIVPERGVPEDGWLHPDGSITKAVCGD